jgi:hypothetical protein
MTLRSRRIASWTLRVHATGLVALACAASGCINPKDDYNDFASRPLTEREASVSDVQQTPCQELLGQNLSGSFYVTCLPSTLAAPFALATTQKVSANEDGTTGTLELSFTPLTATATKMSDTTGPTTPLPKTTIDSMCAYTINIGTLTLPSDANTLGRDLTATHVVLRGKMQTVDQACGELDGEVTLINLNLNGDGDYCMFVRAPADGSIPTVDNYSCPKSGLQPRGM